MSENESRDDAPQDAPAEERVGKRKGHRSTKAPESLDNPAVNFKRGMKDVTRNIIAKKFSEVDFASVTRKEATKWTKLNPALIQALCVELAKGHYPRTACRLVGISQQRVDDWLVQGRKDLEYTLNLEAQGVKIRPKDITLHHLLYVSVDKALHMSEDRDLASIDFAAQVGIWQAAAWKLERRHSERWEKRMKVQTEGTLDVRAQVQHIIITPDQAPSLEQWQADREKRMNQQNAPQIEGQAVVIPDQAPKSNPVGFDEVMR